MTLDQVAVGKEVIITKVGGEGELRCRFLDMSRSRAGMCYYNIRTAAGKERKRRSTEEYQSTDCRICWRTS